MTGDAGQAGPTAPEGATGLRAWWIACVGAVALIPEANMMLVAAGVAFFAMLSLFPALAALIAVWGLLADPDVLMRQIEMLDHIIPEEVLSIIVGQVTALLQTSPDKLTLTGLVSLLLAIWSARAGVAALIIGLNMIHGYARRGSVRHYATAALLTLALFGVAVVSLVLLLALPIFLRIFPPGPMTGVLVELGRWIGVICVLLAGLALLYRYGPNTTKDARLKWITPGAGVAIALWFVSSWGLTIYLTNFGSINEVYGSIGAAIALLIWLFVSAISILLGAAINVQLDRARSGQLSVSQFLP